MSRYVLLKAGAEGVVLPDGTSRDAADAIDIASSTNATPIQVNTSAAHGLSTGDLVFIADHATNTAANGLWPVTVVDADSFTLDDSVGNGVGGATGTVRSDIVELTDEQFSQLSPGAIDGDPLLDLGIAPSLSGDEVTRQGGAATTTATAPVALTSTAPAALTSAQIAGGESPTEAEYNQLQADVAALRTVLAALRTDVSNIRTRQATVITELVGLDTAVSGAGKAVAP